MGYSDRQRDGQLTTLAVAGVLGVFLLVSAPPAAGAGPAATSITPSGLGTTVTQAGQTFNLTGGTRPGNGANLFHSFGDFSVATGNIANFQNETALPTSNILSRVTGGAPSSIYGTLQTTGFGAANLYLINPAGVVFGPTASLNVGGSLAVSTADYLRLTDNTRFNAAPGPADALLTVAPVEAFGFTSPRPVAITLEGSTLGAATQQ
ncbi:MAG: filamentous hemagglutinin N-terminal domain-containing protein, partial [Burkholderiaceae bacterium]|nr:filamentous hemagglutinin N-terminal domain-containing protein [Burkholderiaceae bacterium]